MSRRRVVVILVGGLLGAGSAVAPVSHAADTECIGASVMNVSPGMSETPTSGTHAARNGTEQCTGPLNGATPTGDPTVEWDGRYGTTDPDTCSAGGEGWGVAHHTVPTREGPKVVRNVFTFTYGGLENGLMSGAFKGDYFSGTLAFRPLEGDCVTVPVSRLEATFRGTWHEYRPN